jgi:hypothetical protein
MFFIATKPRAIEGVSEPAALIRVQTPAKQAPHLAFETRELADSYLDAKAVAEQLDAVDEESLNSGVSHHFRYGVILIRSEQALASFIDKPEEFNYQEAMAEHVDLVSITSAIVETPLGPMIKASSVRSNIAMAIDLFFVTIIARFTAETAMKLMPTTPGITAQTLTVMILFMAFCIYMMRRKLPRFRTPAEWAFGLRGFEYSELPGYSGSEFLCCREILHPSEDSRRTKIISLIVAVLVVGSLST